MRECFAVLVILAACGSSANDPTPSPDAPAACTPPPNTTAPTYTELFATYFAPGTPGHCATAGCHADPAHTIWLCGTTKDSCYAGMVDQGLIDPANPAASAIGDPTASPLSWINPSGAMPFDTAGPLPAGRDAILAWVAACAQNN
jgi:hypothetical protein